MFRFLVIAVFACAAACAQTMTEGALLTGAGATGAAATGKKAQNTAGTMVARAVAAKKPASRNAPRGRQAPTIPQGENRDVEDTRSSVDPDAVKPGLTRDELVALAGKPWMKMTIPGADGHYSERFRYQLKAGGVLSILLTDSKVVDVKRLPE